MQKILTAVFSRIKSSKELIHFFLIEFPDFLINTVADACPFDRSLDQSGIFELFQMLGDGRLCKTEFVHKVTADAGVGFNDLLNDGDPGRVGQGLEEVGLDLVERLGGAQELVGDDDRHDLMD